MLKSLHYLLFITFGLIGFNQFFAQQDYYYPPTTGNTWETLAPDSLGWCQERIDSLYQFLEDKNTKSFIILKEGKIVLEKYFGTYTQDSIWYYASAGKSVMAFLIGMAQEEGLLDINAPTHTYLGRGWTTCTPAQEDKITLWHQLSMTTGLDDGLAPTAQIPDPLNCLEDSCLQYLTEPGTRWAYHNAPYRLLQDVLESTTSLNKNQYTRTRLLNRVGMQGFWFNYIFFGRARDMARFGHLVLSKGVWDGDSILKDQSYIQAMSMPSQAMNESYGLLWWLNGQTTHLLPRSQFVFNGSLAPNAPADAFAALGKNDQKIYVVPSKDMIVVRQGNDAGTSPLAVSSFDNELWGEINKLSCSTTAIQASSLPAGWKVFPQPAEDRIWISGHEVGKTYSFSIYNLQGQLFVNQLEFADTDRIVLEIGEIPAGIYVLEVSEGEYLSRQKVVIR